METLITILGLILGIVGLIGTCLTLLTYLNPMLRFRWYMRKPQNWETLAADVQDDGFYRHNRHPEFIIERTDRSERWERPEPWMHEYPDPNKWASMVHLKISGQLLAAERFISLDGGRYFVPVPKVIYAKGGKEEDNIYYYSRLQQQICRIIGSYHRTQSIEAFMKEHGIKREEDLPVGATTKRKKSQ